MVYPLSQRPNHASARPSRGLPESGATSAGRLLGTHDEEVAG